MEILSQVCSSLEGATLKQTIHSGIDPEGFNSENASLTPGCGSQPRIHLLHYPNCSNKPLQQHPYILNMKPMLGIVRPRMVLDQPWCLLFWFGAKSEDILPVIALFGSLRGCWDKHLAPHCRKSTSVVRRLKFWRTEPYLDRSARWDSSWCRNHQKEIWPVEFLETRRLCVFPKGTNLVHYLCRISQVPVNVQI